MPSYERPDAEKERSPEAEPVSEQFLRELFSSPELFSALEEAGRVTSRHGNESAFAVLKALSSDERHFTDVIEGGTEYTKPGREIIDQRGFETVSPSLATEALKKKLRRRAPKKTFFTLAVFHLHGGRKPAITEITPSDQDLESAFRFRKENEATTRYDIPPVEMTGSLTREGEMRIMVYQEPTHYRPLEPSAIKDELLEGINDARGEEEAAETLRHYGYKVAVVETSGGKLKEEDVASLASAFVFTPRRFEEKEE